ncbi:ABC transporter permease, partial [mine drainage metagenome]
MHFLEPLTLIKSPCAIRTRIPSPREDPRRALGNRITTPRRTGGEADTLETLHRGIEPSTRGRARERDRRIHAVRTREIATLRALGFARTVVLLSVLLEVLALALVGGVCGGALAYAVFNGLRATTYNQFSVVAFRFAVTPHLIAVRLAYALVLGLIGGLLPAIRAARLSIAAGLRRESGSEHLEDPRRAHAGADAHRHHAEALQAPVAHAVHQRRGANRSGRPQRMAKRDGAAVRIDALGVQPEVADHRHRLRGEGLVQLDPQQRI